MNPISSTPEAMSLVAFLIAAGYLATSFRYRIPAAGAFAVPAALALLVLARLAPAEASTPHLGTLGSAHILLATLGVAVFALAAVLALLYLFQDRQLKRKKFERVMGVGTPLETLDRLALRCVSIGFPVSVLLSPVTAIVNFGMVVCLFKIQRIFGGGNLVVFDQRAKLIKVPFKSQVVQIIFFEKQGLDCIKIMSLCNQFC